MHMLELVHLIFLHLDPLIFTLFYIDTYSTLDGFHDGNFFIDK